MNRLLKGYIDSEVEHVSSFVVSNALKKVHEDFSPSYFQVQRNGDRLESISYNSKEIDRFKNRLTEEIQRGFSEVERGEFQEYPLGQQEKLRSKYPFFQNGYLCEVSANSIRSSTLFGNLGPMIPIKLSFMGYVSSSINLQTKEYGINSVIVEVDVVVHVTSMISMPISSRSHDTLVKEVVSLDVINGEIPKYYSGFHS